MEKRMKRNFFASLALALVLGCSAIGFVGCGESTPDTPPSPPIEEDTTCTVTFETNGGSAVEAVTVEEGTTIDLADYTTQKSGSYFYGWAIDEALTTRADKHYTVVADATLYAQWAADEKYTLYFETNGGTTIAPVMYRPNDYLAAPAEPTKTNCTFGGWYADEALTKEFSFYTMPQMPAKDTTIYAKWNTMNAIVFQTNGGSEIEAVYGAVGDPVDVEEPTKTGYIFEGWYKDAACTTPYDVSMIPAGVVTVYAKWHEQIKNVTVKLHVNFEGLTSVTTISGNEGEALNDAAAIEAFTGSVNNALVASYLGDASDVNGTPIMKFSKWAYDANGNNRFGGEIPHVSELNLYAVWSRSAAYCEISFVENETVTSYFVKKNSIVSETVLDQHLAAARAQYEALGCSVEGFYTAGGNRYVAGDMIAMDMRLIPYVYSSDLAYEYATMKTAAGVDVNGYVLKGYQASKAAEYAAKDSLLLLVPQYYNDGTHGELPVIWIGESAFANFNVSEVTLPSSLMGIASKAFMNTKLTKIVLPESVHSLGDNVFSGSTQLADITISGTISYLGATIFKDTAYEAQMPEADGFIFFDAQRTIIYSYVGTAATVTTPSTARTIVSGAFQGNTTITKLTLGDGIRYVGDYAFENAAVENVTIGKFFATMGVGIFKNCTALHTVKFTSKYNLAAIGESMFEGCSALANINLSELESLKQINARAFFGCASLQSMQFTNNFLSIGESSFENCTSLVSVDFGVDGGSQFNEIGKRAFAGCTSLKRIILRGDLINNTIVTFKTEVFAGAGYMKNGVMAKTIIYVKDMSVDNWRGDEDEKIYSYVDIYQMRLPVAYRDMPIKPIDAYAPELTTVGTLTMEANNAVDLMAYLTAQNAFSVYDDASEIEDCIVSIEAVMAQSGQMIAATEGKYNLSAKGEYTVLLTAEDEFGNVTQAELTLIVA